MEYGCAVVKECVNAQQLSSACALWCSCLSAVAQADLKERLVPADPLNQTVHCKRKKKLFFFFF